MIIKKTIIFSFAIGLSAIVALAAKFDSFQFPKAIIAAITLAANLYYANTQVSIQQLRAKKSEKLSRMLLYGTFALFITFFLIDLYLGELNIFVSAAGMPLVITGSFVYAKSISYLGKYFSLDVEIKESHKLLKTGPFARARHPAYFGSLILFAGMALEANSIACAAILAFIFLPAYYYRITVEEKALAQEFGKEFWEYKKTTPMIIPKLF